MIRPAKAEDRQAIAELIAMYPSQLEQVHLPDIEDFFVAVENVARAPLAISKWQGAPLPPSEVVGCCALEVYSPKIAEVRSLAVRREFSGRGIATALVNACVEKARSQGVGQVLAITSSLEFFDKFGFKTFNQEKYAMFKVLK